MRRRQCLLLGAFVKAWAGVRKDHALQKDSPPIREGFKEQPRVVISSSVEANCNILKAH